MINALNAVSSVHFNVNLSKCNHILCKIHANTHPISVLSSDPSLSLAPRVYRALGHASTSTASHHLGRSISYLSVPFLHYTLYLASLAC